MKKRILIAAIAAFFTHAANAAPFCTVHSWGRTCIYHNWIDCEKAAGKNGICVVNNENPKPQQHGNAPMCVVTSFSRQCHFYDAEICRNIARQNGGVCVVR
jgi:hypothetical protein